MLSPRRALLHPAWLLSLAALILNDRVLKGGHLLPSILTGKLSDFAGLFVAPALLAVMVRARSKRSVIASHVVVAIVFAIVKTTPFATHVFERVLSIAFASRVWTDPTDLVALPMVALSYVVLVPVMEPHDEGWVKRAGSRAMTAFAAVMCMATSKESEPAVQFQNQGTHKVSVILRELVSGVDIDESALKNDPIVISDTLFAPPSSSFDINNGGKFNPNVRGPLVRMELVDTKTNQHRIFHVLFDSNLDIRIQDDLRVVSSNTVREVVTNACVKPHTPAKALSAYVPYGGELTISDMKAAGDCLELSFVERKDKGAVCLPAGAWPFQVGDRVHNDYGAIVSSDGRVRVRVDAVSENQLVKSSSCTIVDSCGGAGLEVRMKASDGTMLEPGDDRTIGNTRMIVGSLESPVIVRPTCGSGFTTLGTRGVYATITTQTLNDAGTD